jgi:hypothetical protein
MYTQVYFLRTAKHIFFINAHRFDTIMRRPSYSALYQRLLARNTQLHVSYIFRVHDERGYQWRMHETQKKAGGASGPHLKKYLRLLFYQTLLELLSTSARLTRLAQGLTPSTVWLEPPRIGCPTPLHTYITTNIKNLFFLHRCVYYVYMPD